MINGLLYILTKQVKSRTIILFWKMIILHSFILCPLRFGHYLPIIMEQNAEFYRWKLLQVLLSCVCIYTLIYSNFTKYKVLNSWCLILWSKSQRCDGENFNICSSVCVCVCVYKTQNWCKTFSNFHSQNSE